MSSDAPVHIVDDDLAVRQALAFLLATDGLAVRVHDSATAFLAAETERVGCVVTDVRMPGIDGVELLERERQVLEGLVAGKANKVIGLDLGISPRTVEIYRANVMSKLQAGSLSELVRMALIAGQADGD